MISLLHRIYIIDNYIIIESKTFAICQQFDNRFNQYIAAS